MDSQSSTTITLRMVESLDEVTRKGVPHVVDFTILQLNDVYEAAPVEGGRLGGLARTATLVRQLRKENPNFFSVMIGDFLAPSAIGATTGDSGQHMIEALNATGLDYATVGNHEFDFSEGDLVLRIEESKFKWIISNVTNGDGRPFPKAEKHAIIEFKNDAGETARVALIGVCLDQVKKPWLRYQNSIESAREQVAELEGSADIFVAMTHLTIAEDKQLGAEVPRLDVLLGGHEHEAAKAIVGEDATPIFKADSNARSAFIHRFRYNTQTRVTDLHSELIPIDCRFEAEPETEAIVKKWEKITFDTLRAQGNEPLSVVGRTKETLNGYEAAVRSGPTNLTDFILESFHQEVPTADAVMFAAGFIRIDSIIPPGDITYFDVVRIFPTGGKLTVASISGRGLSMLLQRGESAKGGGGFMQLRNLTRDERGWLIKGERILEDTMYTIIMNEIATAAFAYPPLKGRRIEKLFDTREVRAILADRLRRDMAEEDRKLEEERKLREEAAKQAAEEAAKQAAEEAAKQAAEEAAKQAAKPTAKAKSTAKAAKSKK